MSPAWIIPARAGFTLLRRGGPQSDQDHPRSRGVYSPARYAGRLSAGSSPLARGLPLIRMNPWPLLGIIPARAGFTGRRRSLQRLRQDHPRSRGVYSRTLTSSSPSSGSSPLARGLLQLLLGRQVHVGIIPARAGFTGWPGARTARGRDHPRSRGVYCPALVDDARGWGSSPLARGLHRDDRIVHGLQGIIPARAGFTQYRQMLSGGAVDHPRSRGVYALYSFVNARCQGSSPLARGLPGRRPGRRSGVGIIPARAGFTASPGTRWGQAGDHPRSRGVYTISTGTQCPSRWIIPARAGFTRCR